MLQTKHLYKQNKIKINIFKNLSLNAIAMTTTDLLIGGVFNIPTQRINFKEIQKIEKGEPVTDKTIQTHSLVIDIFVSV